MKAIGENSRVLVVGGGIGGMSAAISLARLGVAVDLIDIDPLWRVYGAGITITGATLRAFDALGVLEELEPQAYTGSGIQICDVLGRHVTQVPTPVAQGSSVQSSGGVMRPVLHSVLSARTRSLGIQVRLGLTVDRLASDAEGVDVTFSDGTQGRYALVVGADGLFSRVRQLLMPHAPRPAFTGQYVWRLVAPRPPEIERRHYFLGGPVKVGLSPVSRTEMYMFLLETTPERRPIVADEQLPPQLRRLLEGYGGPLARIRDTLGAASRIVLRPLECFQLPAPWHVGRVILIGDAAHPTTPHLASGAGMAVEDALVLAQELRDADGVDAAFAGFMRRRHARCRLVVDNSLEIGRLEQACAPVEQQTRLVAESLEALAQPI